jgi:hypothetical protein
MFGHQNGYHLGFQCLLVVGHEEFQLSEPGVHGLAQKEERGNHEVADFRLISLIHNVSKLIAKVLSSRLALHMQQLVQPNQSAFVKGRMIHDNFLVVQL